MQTGETPSGGRWSQRYRYLLLPPVLLLLAVIFLPLVSPPEDETEAGTLVLVGGSEGLTLVRGARQLIDLREERSLSADSIRWIGDGFAFHGEGWVRKFDRLALDDPDRASTIKSRVLGRSHTFLASTQPGRVWLVDHRAEDHWRLHETDGSQSFAEIRIPKRDADVEYGPVGITDGSVLLSAHVPDYADWVEVADLSGRFVRPLGLRDPEGKRRRKASVVAAGRRLVAWAGGPDCAPKCALDVREPERNEGRTIAPRLNGRLIVWGGGSFSPDEKFLAVTAELVGEGLALLLVDLETMRARLVAEDVTRITPAWSSDGKQLYWAVGDSRETIGLRMSAGVAIQKLVLLTGSTETFNVGSSQRFTSLATN